MSSSITVATWNVNSVRARMELLSDWIKANNPDILLLQETKCRDCDFPLIELESWGYNIDMVGEKSYNGVAIMSKYPISVESKKLSFYDIEGVDEEARYIEGVIEIKGLCLRVASVYVPNGDSKLQDGEALEDSKRFIYKLNFFERLKKRMEEMLKIENEITIIGGDYNVAHKEIDLNSPKSAEGGVGFHMKERNHMTSILDSGYYDMFREKHPDDVEYSWWNYRFGGWQKNYGWRIDYLMVNENALKNCSDCFIDKPVRGLNRPSDHVPVVMTINC